MKYLVECSFGEIVDKLTILSIKLAKATNTSQKNNIQKEYNTLQKFAKKDNDTYNRLFSQLYIINKKLWVLEDLIRRKSQNKEFDDQYIKFAEKIHTTNDKRYEIKKRINLEFESDIIEEKIYIQPRTRMINDTKPDSADSLNPNVQDILMRAKFHFSKGNLDKTEKLLQEVIDSKPNIEVISDAYISLHIMHASQNRQALTIDKVKSIVTNTKKYFPNNNITQIHHATTTYGRTLLKFGDYHRGFEYFKYYNPVNAIRHGINPDTMSYFDKNDKNKTLLVYTSGGLGDCIMFGRVLSRLCKININNYIILIVHDKLFWIFNNFSNIYKNITILRQSESHMFPRYDYHVNLCLLGHMMNLHKDDYTLDPYLQIIANNSSLDLSNILNNHVLNIVINWHGNSANTHEKHNRSITLEILQSIFSIPNINWISVQKNVNSKDKKFMKAHNIQNLASIVDNNDDAFCDTIKIFKHVDLVISTDTSLLHVAGSLGVRTWGLLTFACEWRWGRDEHTIWYPKMRLFRQNRIADWSDVVSKLHTDLIKLSLVN